MVNPRITENDENLYEDLPVFQQDGTPPHFAIPMGQFLNDTFPAGWIARIASLDDGVDHLNRIYSGPIDFFLMGVFKNKNLLHRIEKKLRQLLTDVCNVKDWKLL